MARLTLTLHPPTTQPLGICALNFVLEIENAGDEPAEFPAPSGWDLDVPGSLEHSSDSQGLLWIRALGQEDPGDQRYSCTEVEAPPPDMARLEPGQRLEVSLGGPSLPGGSYQALVRLYQPEVSSERIQFGVAPV